MLHELRQQCRIVFWIPVLVGMSAMFFLYFLMMYANDGKLTAAELYGMAACLGVLLLMVVLILAVYKRTVRTVRRQLDI